MNSWYCFPVCTRPTALQWVKPFEDGYGDCPWVQERLHRLRVHGLTNRRHFRPPPSAGRGWVPAMRRLSSTSPERSSAKWIVAHLELLFAATTVQVPSFPSHRPRRAPRRRFPDRPVERRVTRGADKCG